LATPQVDRQEVPLIADERSMLEAWLDYHRATLLLKCSGLSNDQLKSRSVEPSSLSLLGLVRHMTDIERGWFRRGVGGKEGPDVDPIYYSEEQPEGDFDDLDDKDAEEVFEAYLKEVERCRAAAAHVSLDEIVSPRTKEYSVRWIYLHMIEEYARHNGHADLIRERIDGATGD
jgi:uncharacterized damage-inducible protein DinB